MISYKEMYKLALHDPGNKNIEIDLTQLAKIFQFGVATHRTTCYEKKQLYSRFVPMFQNFPYVF